MSEMSDKSDQQRAVEDVPELRSVMIRSSAPPSIGRLSPPLGKLSKMPTTIDQSRITIKADTKRQSSSVFRWEQNELPSLPADYSLVRTNVYVRDSTAQVVADRICNELKNQSIVIDTKGCDQKVSFQILALQRQTNLEPSIQLNVISFVLIQKQTELSSSRNTGRSEAHDISIRSGWHGCSGGSTTSRLFLPL